MTSDQLESVASEHNAGSLPADLQMGAVRLKVADLARSIAFYTRVIGLELLETAGDGDIVRLAAATRPLIELEEARNARPRPLGAPGLFHVALLMPNRASLAVVLRRLLKNGIRIGASDHLVSEALYLNDPDGHGIEIYRDRPAAEWTWDRGTIEMASNPLDLRVLLADAPADVALDAPMPDGTTVGHVHLQVGDLERARLFYADRLGFAVTTERYPGALFVSAGRYHHHLGLNVWHSRGAGVPPAGIIGLSHFEIRLSDPEQIEAIRSRLIEAGESVSALPNGFSVADPWGTQLHFCLNP